MKTIAIVAVSENNVIGVNGRIPWHIPEDLRQFKKETKGHAVIMGRKTAESLIELGVFPLPERKNYVVSKSMLLYSDLPHNVTFCNNLKVAIDSAAGKLGGKPNGKAFLIGGENIYREGLQYCDELLLTRVHETIQFELQDNISFFDLGWMANKWEGFSEECLGKTSDGRASFYKYVRVRR